MSLSKPRPSWISQLFGREIVVSPRQSPTDIPAARAFWDLSHLNRDLPDLAAFHERIVLRNRDGVDLTAEIYMPHGKGPFPTLLYIHGGSWVLWSAAHVRKMCMRIAEQGHVVVNLEYGLAPEHPFPWALQDTIYATRWIAKNIGRYSGIGDNVVLGGDSAGANLAAATIIALQGAPGLPPDEDPSGGARVAVTGALLPYGIFDFPLLFAEPGRNATNGVIETTWNLAYLGPNFIKHHRNPLVSPIYWPRLNEFPPCYLNCGARDALLPQTLYMAKALANADVPTTVSVVAELDHAFLLLADSVPAAEREMRRMFAWIADVTRNGVVSQ